MGIIGLFIGAIIFTPQFFSPCGFCLVAADRNSTSVIKPYYDFLGVTADPITDGMLIP